MCIDFGKLLRKELKAKYSPVDAVTEILLVRCAQAGDKDACETLFHSVSLLILRELAKQEWGNEANLMGEAFQLFHNCLERFDLSRGLRLSTWIGSKFGWSRQDAWRRKSNDPMVVQTATEDSATAITAWDREQARAYEREEEPPRDAQAEWKALLECYPEGSKERQLLETMHQTYLEGDCSQAAVARKLGCKRQNINQMLGRIRRSHLDSHSHD